MANKRKTTTTIVAGAVAAILLLGGTFAWTSISQQAKNEAAGIVNVGGRLHDDFNGENKDVYVENFTDPLNGGQPIFARVRLDEYMEVGQDAGGFGVDMNNDDKIVAVPVIDGTDINDVKTWTTHVPSSACEVCAAEGTCVIHEHWVWEMGGQTTYMPTFNKDKDSLDADINGTYHGTDDSDKVYYDDYVVYTTDNTKEGVGVDVDESNKKAYDGEIYSVIGTAYYDNDTDGDPNDHVNGVGVRPETEIHTAKNTGTADVILMADWDGTPGNYWVYDFDGWAYWANPIMPGEATGLLLDSIKLEKNPGEKCYYSINVVAQFATVGDWEYFTDGGAPGEKALELLNAASRNVPTVTVNGGDGKIYLGDEVQFDATVNLGIVAALSDAEVEWSLLNDDGTAYTGESVISDDGILSVSENDADGTIITVVAESVEYPGAIGMKSVQVYARPDVVFDVTAVKGITTYAHGSSSDDTYTVNITGNDAEGGTVKWSVTDGDGNALTKTTLTPSEDGMTAGLSIGADETALTIIVSASYTLKSGYSVSYTNEITRTNPPKNIETTDDLSATAYGVCVDDGTDNGTYTAYLIRSATKPTTNDMYNGQMILKVVENVENKNGATNSPFTNVTSIITANKIVIGSGQNSFRSYCREKYDLTHVDFSKMDTSNVTDGSDVFRSCSKLTEVILPENFLCNATNISTLFFDCSSLENLELPAGFGDHAQDLYMTFSGCTKLTNLELPAGFGDEATSLSSTFDCCSSLETLTLPEGFGKSATNMENMFYNCTDLQTIVFPESWDTSNVNTMTNMFKECKNLTLDCSGWNVNKVNYYDGFANKAPGVIPPSFR